MDSFSVISAVVSLALSVGSLLLSLHLYYKCRYSLSFQAHRVTIAGIESDSARYHIVVWNSGAETIDASHVVDPLHFDFGEVGFPIRSQVIASTRKANKVRLFMWTHAVKMEFSYLDPGDGVLFAVSIGRDGAAPKIGGTIKGLAVGPLGRGRLPYPSSGLRGRLALCLSLPYLILATVLPFGALRLSLQREMSANSFLNLLLTFGVSAAPFLMFLRCFSIFLEERIRFPDALAAALRQEFATNLPRAPNRKLTLAERVEAANAEEFLPWSRFPNLVSFAVPVLGYAVAVVGFGLSHETRSVDDHPQIFIGLSLLPVAIGFVLRRVYKSSKENSAAFRRRPSER